MIEYTRYGDKSIARPAPIPDSTLEVIHAVLEQNRLVLKMNAGLLEAIENPALYIALSEKTTPEVDTIE